MSVLEVKRETVNPVSIVYPTGTLATAGLDTVFGYQITVAVSTKLKALGWNRTFSGTKLAAIWGPSGTMLASAIITNGLLGKLNNVITLIPGQTYTVGALVASGEHYSNGNTIATQTYPVTASHAKSINSSAIARPTLTFPGDIVGDLTLDLEYSSFTTRHIPPSPDITMGDEEYNITLPKDWMPKDLQEWDLQYSRSLDSSTFAGWIDVGTFPTYTIPDDPTTTEDDGEEDVSGSYVYRPAEAGQPATVVRPYYRFQYRLRTATLQSEWSEIGYGGQVRHGVAAGDILPGSIGNDELATDIDGSHIQNGTINGVKLIDGTVSADKVIAHSITAGQIAANTITANEIAALTITAGEIRAGTITANEIQAGSITSGVIAAGTIQAVNIQTGAIIARTLAADAVTSNAILSGAVDATKINVSDLSSISANFGNMTAGTITGVTITGGTIRTAASGARVQLSSAGMTAFNSGGTAVLDFSTSTGNLVLAGAVTANAGSSVPTSVLDVDVTLSGAVLITSNSIPGGHLLVDAITSREIHSDAVTTSKILARNIIAGHIATGTITANEIAAGTITANKLTVQAGGYNFVKNSGFEDDIGSEWTYTSSGSLTLNYDSTTFKFGARAAKLGDNTTSSHEQLEQTLVLPVDSYVATAWVKWSGMTTGGASGISIEAVAGTSTTITVTEVTQAAVNTSSTSAGGWIRLRTKFDVTSGSSVKIRVHKGTSGTHVNGLVYVDGIQTEQGDLETSWSQNIDSTVIEGGTITAGTYRSAKTGARVELTGSHGFRYYDSSGNVNIEISASADGMILGAANDSAEPSQQIRWIRLADSVLAGSIYNYQFDSGNRFPGGGIKRRSILALNAYIPTSAEYCSVNVITNDETGADLFERVLLDHSGGSDYAFSNLSNHVATSFTVSGTLTGGTLSSSGGSVDLNGNSIVKGGSGELSYGPSSGTHLFRANASHTGLGDIFYTNANPPSDIRYKNNVETILNAVDKIDQLRGITFTWKDSGRKAVGVVAQDVLKVFPELVTEVDDKYHLNYEALIGPLVQAIKELNTRVKELENES